MQFFDSDGVRIAYIDVAPASSGAGDPVLLIHGFGSNHAVNWVNTQWVKTLTHAGYRAIALDNRGHGQSDKLYDPPPTRPPSWPRTPGGCSIIPGSAGPT